MEKRTLKFRNLIEMATFSKNLSVGYLMNTNNYTLTGRFSDADIEQALQKHQAMVIDTTDKIFSYETIL
ncbi:MAG: hypothetical protein ACXVMS_05110 [Flavisolibacter sp.]